MALRQELIFGVLTPVDEQEWINNPQAVIEEVERNRKALRLDENDTAAEAERLLTENALPDNVEFAYAAPLPKGIEQAEAITHGRTASVCSAYYHGFRTTPRARDALWCLNQALQADGSEKSDLNLMQGSCSTSVGASAGTHAGGDAGDMTAYNFSKRVKFGRLIGFNIHHRTALRNVWSEHIHWTLLKSSTVSRAAQQQNDVWYARYGNGLANNGKANGFLPHSKVIKFERKDTGWWIANRNTAGYAQPGKYDKKMNRDKGWTFKSIGVVSINGVRYLFNENLTFYPKDDFNSLIDDWVKDEQTYKVVKETIGYDKMWDNKAAGTLRQPGYIIKTVGRSKKSPIGVSTENGIWYRQSDLVKVSGSQNNPKDEGSVVKDTGIYEVTANPSLYALRQPGIGSEKVTTRPKGTEIRGINSQVVAGDKWIQGSDELWYHSYYLKQTGEQPIVVVEPEPEPEPEPGPVVGPQPPNIPVDDLLPEDVPIEAFSAEWRVVVDNKEGTVGPGGSVAVTRPKGYHLFTTQKAIHENKVYYISYLGYWYSSDGLLPWDVPDTPVPEPTPEPPKPTPTPEPEPVPPTPVPPKVPTKEKFVAKAGTQNIQRWRLETRPMGHAPWHRGASYAERCRLFAIEVAKLSLDIIGTQEAGTYKDRDTLSDALSKATKHKWAGILHGDNGDITMGVHWDTTKYKLRKEGSIKSYGSTHNKHTYVKLEHLETGRPLWVVSCHLRYGKTFTNHRVKQIKDIVEGAWELAGKDPIIFLGDFNNYARDRQAVSKAMSRNGYDRASLHGTTKLKDSLNELTTRVSRATQWFDNIYFHKSRKILKAGIHAKFNGTRYATPFVADHNLVWAHLET